MKVVWGSVYCRGLEETWACKVQGAGRGVGASSRDFVLSIFGTWSARDRGFGPALGSDNHLRTLCLNKP